MYRKGCIIHKQLEKSNDYQVFYSSLSYKRYCNKLPHLPPLYHISMRHNVYLLHYTDTKLRDMI